MDNRDRNVLPWSRGPDRRCLVNDADRSSLAPWILPWTVRFAALAALVLLALLPPVSEVRAEDPAAATVAETSDGGAMRDLLRLLRQRREALGQTDPVALHGSATTKLQLASASIRRCIDGLQNTGGASEVLQLLRERPGRLDLIGPDALAAFQKAGIALDQADLETCAQAVDIHAQAVPLGDPETRLTEVDRSLQRCISSLQRIGPNAAATGILSRTGRKIGEDNYTSPATLRALEGAVGPLDLTPQDLEICVATYSRQAIQENRVASASPPVANPSVRAGEGDYYNCNQGYFACFGTSPFPTCCPDNISVCSQTCSGFGQCAPWCESKCFPAGATVRTAGGLSKPMREVEVGDRLRVLRPDGSVGYEDVYLLTHKDAVGASRYVTLTLASGARLTLSPRHFIPVAPEPQAPDWKHRVLKGADEVKVGDVVWVEQDDKVQPSMVSEVAAGLEVGAFNPLTLSGTIIVDGVVASAHSDWFLDGLVSADLQARVYQAVLAPVRLAYRAIGPAWTRRISEDLGVVDAVRDATTRPGAAWLAWPAAMLLLPLAGAVLLRRRRAPR